MVVVREEIQPVELDGARVCVSHGEALASTQAQAQRPQVQRQSGADLPFEVMLIHNASPCRVLDTIFGACASIEFEQWHSEGPRAQMRPERTLSYCSKHRWYHCE